MAGDRGKHARGALTAQKKGRFLEALAETCCVAKAAAAVGHPVDAFYRIRLRDPAFAAQWQEAIAIGYAQVEERLILDAMGRQANDNEGADGSGGGRMDKYEREQALNLLKYHREMAFFGTSSRGGGTPRKISEEADTDAAILARLAAVKKRLGR